MEMEIKHWGAVDGVTGSCHQLVINPSNSILVDCGLFQGADSVEADLAIEFDISTVCALLVTHCHIDHVGRIPYLLAAGFKGPIFASEATAALLPLVIEDALKIGVTKKKTLINAYLNRLKRQLLPINYKNWFDLPLAVDTGTNAASDTAQAKARFQPAGHILGSAYIEIELGIKPDNHRVVFSGDLGATHTPLLPALKSPYRADTLVIESTYGDHNHEGRRHRQQALKKVIERCLDNAGTVLIPAFSIGRTQELLYELEEIIHRTGNISTDKISGKNSSKTNWQQLDIIVDSPLAAKFTKHYRSLRKLWNQEAKKTLAEGRHPLSFEQLITIDTHAQHQKLVNHLRHSGRPAVVISASGMCSGGRIQNYLQELLPDERTDVLFVGYQGRGTPGRAIQKYGPKGGYVMLAGRKIPIKANIHTISGYSAHADQNDLINFVKRMTYKPKHIRIVHGDDEAKLTLQKKLRLMVDDVVIGTHAKT